MMSVRRQEKNLEHILRLCNFDKMQASSFLAFTSTSSVDNAKLTAEGSIDNQAQHNPDEILIAGLDEAGRGALAGPVVVGCVHFPVFSDSSGINMLLELRGLDDSKKLSAKNREALVPRIKERSLWGIGIASAQEIDKIGIVKAVSLAATRSYEAMGAEVDLLLCDRGITVLLEEHTTRDLMSPLHQLSFIHGDSCSLHIAAASVLAKVARDQIMVDLDSKYLCYGFASHKGYGTAAHLDALRKLGPSSMHRKTFKYNMGSDLHF